MTAFSINEPGSSAASTLVIDHLDPAEVAIGSPDTVLYVHGTFAPGCVIHFAGHDEPTTLNEDGTLSTGLKPSLWGSPATVQCVVHWGSVVSNAVDFVFTDGAEADAALASEAELGRMSRGDLDDLARDRDVDITDAHNKDDVIQALLKDDRKRKRKR